MQTTRRGYSKAFPKGDIRRQYLLDYIPPGLWRSVQAKAKREGLSLRAVMLKLLEEWVEEGRLK